MRRWIAPTLVLSLVGCLAPGERDPTRYPGDRLLARTRPPASPPHPVLQAIGAITPAPQPRTAAPAGPVFCVVALQPAMNGITISGGARPMAVCAAPPPDHPKQ